MTDHQLLRAKAIQESIKNLKGLSDSLNAFQNNGKAFYDFSQKTGNLDFNSEEYGFVTILRDRISVSISEYITELRKELARL